MYSLPNKAIALLGLLALSAAGQVQAIHDPPARVARLSMLQGEVSFSPAGEADWVVAGLNRPLIRGDRLWTGRDGLAELQFGNAALRSDTHTAVTVLDLDDEIAQIELAEGRLNLFVHRLRSGQLYEIATPTLALVIDTPGSYTVEVGRDGRYTDLIVWRGRAEAFGDRSRFPLREGDAIRFHEPRLRDFEFRHLQVDSFHRLVFARDERMQHSPSLRYVSADVIGYDDLDRYGRWSQVRDYGAVWFPTRVDAGWAPYRHGHWIWQEPWGWTWVDDQPWGFASSHYGRWVLVRDRWGWIPTPPRTRAVYAPALVAFVGGSNWSVGVNLRSAPVGWFPLGPRDVYVPSYRVSRDYFTRVNHGPVVITQTQITNVYNNYYVHDRSLAQLDYTYRRSPAAVTVVPSDVFVRSQPVSRAVLRVDNEMMARSEVRRLASHTPTQRSVVGPAQITREQPRREVQQREVLVSRAPPPATPPAHRQELQRDTARARADLPASAAGRPEVTPAPVGLQRSRLRVIDTGQARQIDRAQADRGMAEARERSALPAPAERSAARVPPRGTERTIAEPIPAREAEQEAARESERVRTQPPPPAQRRAPPPQAAEARARDRAEQQRQVIADDAETGRAVVEREREQQRRQAAEQQVRAERAEQAERAQRAEQAELARRAEQAERAQRVEQAELARRAEQAAIAERAQRAEQAERAQRAEQAAIAQRAQRAEQAAAAERERARAAPIAPRASERAAADPERAGTRADHPVRGAQVAPPAATEPRGRDAALERQQQRARARDDRADDDDDDASDERRGRGRGRGRDD
jgi:hypothetical protein